MDQYCVPGAGKRLRPGVGREQAMIYLLALAKDKPVIVNRVAALIKVTAAAAYINKALWLGFFFCLFLCFCFIFLCPYDVSPPLLGIGIMLVVFQTEACFLHVMLWFHELAEISTRKPLEGLTRLSSTQVELWRLCCMVCSKAR